MPASQLNSKNTNTQQSKLPVVRVNSEHVSSRLAERAISCGMITAVAQALKFLLTLVAAVILGRLLNPGDFGLVGMVGTLTALLSMFTDVGLTTATIQAQDLEERQISNLFWVNLLLGMIMGIAGALLAPSLAWFYHDRRLVGITLVLALTFPLTSVALQHRALLNRQMKFRALAIIEVGAMAVSIVVCCIMAASHFGYWSLVGMQLVAAITGSALTWLTSTWRPSLPQLGAQTGKLMRFGFDLTVSSFVHRITRSSDTLLLGRFWGSHDVGLYSRASVLLLRPIDQFLTPIGSVLLPVLSQLQHDTKRYRTAFLRTYDAIGLISFPLSALFLALAHPLVLVLLGSKWEAAASMFAAFTGTALYMPLAFAATWLFTTQGRSRDMLKANILLSALTLISFVAGVPFGALGMILSFSLSGLTIRLPILYYLVGRAGPVRTVDLWMVLLRHLPVWASVYSTTALVHLTVRKLSDLDQLLICIPVGLFVAGVIMFAFEHQRQSMLFLLARVKAILAARGILLKEIPA